MKSGFEPYGITRNCNENRRIREEMFSGFYTHQKMTDSPQLILYKRAGEEKTIKYGRNSIIDGQPYLWRDISNSRWIIKYLPKSHVNTEEYFQSSSPVGKDFSIIPSWYEQKQRNLMS